MRLRIFAAVASAINALRSLASANNADEARKAIHTVRRNPLMTGRRSRAHSFVYTGIVGERTHGKRSASLRSRSNRRKAA